MGALQPAPPEATTAAPGCGSFPAPSKSLQLKAGACQTRENACNAALRFLPPLYCSPRQTSPSTLESLRAGQSAQHRQHQPRKAWFTPLPALHSPESHNCPSPRAPRLCCFLLFSGLSSLLLSIFSSSPFLLLFVATLAQVGSVCWVQLALV